MGAGGRMSLTSDDQRGHRAPHARTPFTVGQLRKAIPPHCFERSLPRAISYLIGDLLLASALLYSTTFISSSGPLAWISWCLYWGVQGCVFTGIWVIAHECGHHAFSDYVLLDDTVGLILHSWLLAPYFSWKISHRRHHSNTGSMEKDEVYIPRTREDVGNIYYLLWDTPPGRLLSIFITLALGWHSYIAVNVTGRSYGRFASHFDPNSPIFSGKERLQVLITDVSLVAVCIMLYKLGSGYGFVWLLQVYGVPVLVNDCNLVLITLLHHTHPSIPHYSDAEWDFLRGALTTVDRDYGILNHMWHHIADTHVLHHIFSSIPHYHAEEATRAVKPILGQYYQFDSTPIPAAIWREFKECLFVEPDSPQEGGIFWYKKK